MRPGKPAPMPDRHSPKTRHTHLFGHPKGLTVLFATEMWERFSYFGMTSLLVLYLVKYLLLPGQAEAVLGYGAVKAALESLFGRLDTQRLASQIFGLYTGFAYLTPVLGGDRAAHLFVAAVARMCVATAFYVFGLRWLPRDHVRPPVAIATTPLSGDERRAVVALLCVFALPIFFWATYDQQFNTLVLWAEDHTDRF